MSVDHWPCRDGLHPFFGLRWPRRPSGTCIAQASKTDDFGTFEAMPRHANAKARRQTLRSNAELVRLPQPGRARATEKTRSSPTLGPTARAHVPCARDCAQLAALSPHNARCSRARCPPAVRTQRARVARSPHPPSEFGADFVRRSGTLSPTRVQSATTTHQSRRHAAQPAPALGAGPGELAMTSSAAVLAAYVCEPVANPDCTYNGRLQWLCP